MLACHPLFVRQQVRDGATDIHGSDVLSFWAPTRRRSVVLVAVAATAVDQAAKALASSSPCGRFVCPERNPSLMLGVPAGSTAFAIVAGLIGFGSWVRITKQWVTFPAWTSGLVVAGIVSNLLDRVFSGSVRDFIAGPADRLYNPADLFLAIGLLWCVGLVTLSRVRLAGVRSNARRLEQDRR